MARQLSWALPPRLFILGARKLLATTAVIRRATASTTSFMDVKSRRLCPELNSHTGWAATIAAVNNAQRHRPIIQSTKFEFVINLKTAKAVALAELEAERSNAVELVLRFDAFGHGRSTERRRKPDDGCDHCARLGSFEPAAAEVAGWESSPRQMRART